MLCQKWNLLWKKLTFGSNSEFRVISSLLKVVSKSALGIIILRFLMFILETHDKGQLFLGIFYLGSEIINLLLHFSKSFTETFINPLEPSIRSRQ